MSEYSDQLRDELYATRDQAATLLPPEHRGLAQAIMELTFAVTAADRGEEAVSAARRRGDPPHALTAAERRYLAEGRLGELRAALEPHLTAEQRTQLWQCFNEQDQAAWAYWQEDFERVLTRLAECFPGLRGALLVTAAYLYRYEETRGTDDWRTVERRLPV